MIKRGTPSDGQGSLMQQGPNNLPEDYDPERAMEAARRRYDWVKEQGQLKRVRALVDRNGFQFFPHSALEYKALHTQTEPLIADSSASVGANFYEGSLKKGNSEKKARSAERYGKRITREDMERKIRGFSTFSAVNAAYLHEAIEQNGGKISPESFTNNQEYRIDPNAHPGEVRFDILGFRSLMLYVMVREAATGSNPDVLKNGNRRWLRPDHTRFYRRSINRAIDLLDHLAVNEFNLLVDEADQHFRSRFIYWCEDDRQRAKYRQTRKEFFQDEYYQLNLVPIDLESPEFVNQKTD